MTDEVIIQSLTDKVNFINKEVERTGNNPADLIVGIDAEVLVHALKLIQRLQKRADELLRDKGFLIADLINSRKAVKDTANLAKKMLKRCCGGRLKNILRKNTE